MPAQTKTMPVITSPVRSPDAAPLPPLAQSLPVRLMRAREVLMARLRPVLRAHGVTEQQWRVLCTVRDLSETEITVLADRVFLLPPSLSRILRDLEARGLMVRRGSIQDQRRVLVSVTPEGVALIARVEPALAEVRLQARHLFGATRIKALGDLLDELETALGAPDVPDAEDQAV
jgi:homoprotocatechuate degradation regulator HpaR